MTHSATVKILGGQRQTLCTFCEAALYYGKAKVRMGRRKVHACVRCETAYRGDPRWKEWADRQLAEKAEREKADG